mmetsp:Transcript_119016/g.237270  ORF Transcript_119016/g.237270 Transcript_119016/m.237270 type:complete len:618 (-) Transcript_119016:24-1877(-)
MTRKILTRGIGKSIQSHREKEAQRLREKAAPGFFDDPAQQTSTSVLEQSNIDDLIATVELRKANYDELIGETEFVDEGPELLQVSSADAEYRSSEHRDLLSIPRRPRWQEGMDTEELASLESQVFIDWRRDLALVAQDLGLQMTPYERNLDFWRQLWRCAERSDLLVQIVDARDPDFYYCRDLVRYIAELGGGKRVLLLLNKADFLSGAQRQCWADHFAACGVKAVFFSALRELTRQQEQTKHEQFAANSGSIRDIAEAAQEIPVPGLDSDDEDLDEVGQGSEGRGSREDASADESIGPERAPLGILSEDDHDVLDSLQLLEMLRAELSGGVSEASTNESCEPAASAGSRRPRLGTVGFVGYPNVGKSTVINALVGAKRVGMSSRPGKTKHIQTLELPDSALTLCDCPGLVFPSVAATRAHLVINNTMPIDDLRECFSPVRLIIQKVGLERVLSFYDCAAAVQEARKRSGDPSMDDAHALLSALAMVRGHVLNWKVPDENWAARKVLRDYVAGRLLHCEPPPKAKQTAGEVPAMAEASHQDAGQPSLTEMPHAVDEEEEDGDDFDDLEAFLKEQRSGSGRQRNMTKRKERYLAKQQLKGKAVGDGLSGLRAKGVGQL